MLLVVCQLSLDVIDYEDLQCHWCVSIRLLSQFDSCVLFSQIVSWPIVLSQLVLSESINKSFVR